MKCSSPGCPDRPLYLDERCWAHLPDKAAYIKYLALKIRSEKHLTDVNLKNADLSRSDLSGIRLFDACLEGAELVGANLSASDLTHCNLKNADLAKANLTGARLWNTDLSGANMAECDLSGGDFWNAKLFNTKLWGANFRNAKSVTKNSFSSGAKFFDNPGINETGSASAEDSYRNIKAYFTLRGMYNDASWASFKEKTMERLILKKKGDLNYLPSLVMNILCGYGEKPYRIVLSALATIILFAVLFFSLNAVMDLSTPGSALRLSDCIYYSTITFTTVGYGDIIPKPYALFRLIAACEAFIGVFLTGLFIFTLARKYSAR